jgi:hypothetical protein
MGHRCPYFEVTASSVRGCLPGAPPRVEVVAEPPPGIQRVGYRTAAMAAAAEAAEALRAATKWVRYPEDRTKQGIWTSGRVAYRRKA